MGNYGINPNLKFGRTKPVAGKVVEDNFTPIFAMSGKTPSFDDIDKYYGLISEDFNIQGEGGIKEFYSLTAYASVYTRVSQHLKGIIKAVESVRYFYLVEVMLNQITEDALAPRMGDDEILKFSCEDEDIQKELDELQKRIGLDQLIQNIAPDLLAYGEYTLKTKIDHIKEEKEDELNKKGKKIKPKPGKGLVDVTDIVEQGEVISLTQDGYVEGYLVMDKQHSRIEVKEVSDYIKFTLGGQRVKINIEEIVPRHAIKDPVLKEIVDRIPRFIRIGRSEIFPVISKIKELELLEKLIPATKINKLSQGNLVGMNLPENYKLDEAIKAVKRIEGSINRKVAVDPVSNEITVESILSTAGKTKVIPLFGEKGRLEQMDFKDNEPDDLLGSTKEIRELILDSVGIPSELVFKSDSDNRAEIIKRYAKYLRKLKRLQKAISLGCKQMAFIHLANKGYSFKEEQINVVFNNSLVEIDNLDKLEHADVTLSLLSNVRDFFNDMMEEDSPYRPMIKLDKVAEYIETNLATIGLADAILVPSEGGPSAEPANLDKDGVDSKGNPTRQEEPTDDEDQDADHFTKKKEGE